MLETNKLRDLKDWCITIKNKFIIIIQKNQRKKYFFVDIKNNTKK